MFTAKDMHQLLQQNMSVKGSVVDNWIKDVVLPSKLNNNYQGAFDCPEGVTLKEVSELLVVRGFDVKTWSDHQGSFVSVNIPPQGE